MLDLFLGDGIWSGGGISSQDSGSSSGSDFTRIRSKERSEEAPWTRSLEKKQEDAVAAALVLELSVEQCVTRVASLVGILSLLRVLRRWNQTGNKWLNVPDVGDWLVR